jgi:hypothetical protein
LKLIIGSIVILSLVILFLFALFTADISVSRIVEINSSKASVEKKIRDLREWKNWNEFVMNPPQREITNSTNELGVDSNFIDMGGFHVSRLESTADTVFTIWRHGNDSFKGNFILKEAGSQTILEWTLHFHVKWYPWEKLASMFYDKQLGPEMEKSLLNLQKELNPN